jgi:hypothetical protein
VVCLKTNYCSWYNHQLFKLFFWLLYSKIVQYLCFRSILSWMIFSHEIMEKSNSWSILIVKELLLKMRTIFFPVAFQSNHDKIWLLKNIGLLKVIRRFWYQSKTEVLLRTILHFYLIVMLHKRKVLMSWKTIRGNIGYSKKHALLWFGWDDFLPW